MTSARSITRAVVVLAALAAAACAASSRGGALVPGPRPASAASEDDHRAIEQARQAMGAREVELGAAAAQAAPDSVNCARACALEGDICALAERICAIAARDAPGDPVGELCTDGRARCLRAREAVKGRCACSPTAPRP